MAHMCQEGEHGSAEATPGISQSRYPNIWQAPVLAKLEPYYQPCHLSHPMHPYTSWLNLNNSEKNLTVNLTKQEDTDWLDFPNKDLMTALIAKLRVWRTLTTMSDLKSSTSKPDIEDACNVAKSGMAKNLYDNIITTIDSPLKLTG